MPIQGENIPVWIERLNKYLGVQTTKKMGRPPRKINEELLILMHNEGDSNRSIAKQLGLNNRTVDRRIIKLRKEGRIK